MKRQPVKGTARLILMINGKPYVLTNLEPDPCVASPAWRLVKESGVSYDVHLDEHGAHCSCPDFVFAREHAAKKCKHCEALMAVGLLRKDGL